MRIGILTRLGFLAFFLLGLTQLPAQVNVTKTDSLIYDDNGNLLANPGDSLRYKTKVKNPGAGNVTGATMDVNPSANLGPATNFRTTPVAVNDTFAVTANIGISVPAGSGLKINDFDDNLALAALQPQVNQPTAMGGTVSVNADGSFTYSPAAGFSGADNFTYTLLDGNEVPGCPPSNNAIVLLNVAAAPMIWFLDNAGGGTGGTGTVSNPFKTIADFNASAGPQPGHFIFIEHTGTNYANGPILLENTQTLWGTGHTGGSNLADLIAEAPHSVVLPPIGGTRPVIDGGGLGDGIRTASGNNIRGLNVGNCTDFAIDAGGTSVGNLNIIELSINNGSGGGFRTDNGGTLAVTLGNVTTTGGTNGINIGLCGGSFNGGTGTITNPTGAAVTINGGTVGFTYSGNISQGNNAALVSVSGGHNTGTVTFQTGTLSATNGTGLQFDNADSPTSYNFLGTTTLNGGAAAVKISNGSAGSFTFNANTSITSPTDTAFVVIGGTAAVTYSGNITQANNFPMVSVSGGHTTGTITFQTGTLNATNGSGLQFDNADSPTSYNFNGTVTLNGGDAGIDIVNGSVGSFTFSGCTIINPSGDAFELTGSNATVSYTGVIRDVDDYVIDIDNHDANTMTFAGDSIVSTGSGIRVANSNGGTINFNHSLKRLTTTTNTAVDLTSNSSGTMNFGNGNLLITTTSGTGFNASGGGTVNVTGASNTINSGNGSGLNVSNTTIGSSNLNFRSISSSGGTATGIILDNTGSSGGLIVNGDGTDTSVGGNSTGGTIANKTGADLSFTVGCGIYLNNTINVVLRRMTVNGTIQNHGIRGFTVSGFILEYSTINGTHGTNPNNNGIDTYGEGCIVFGNQATSGLTGSATITNCNISGGSARNISIVNPSGTLNRVTITGSNFGHNGSGGNASVSIEARGIGTTINSTIQDCTFTGSPGDATNFTGQGGTNMDVIYGGVTAIPGTGLGNVISNNHPNNNIGGSNLTLASTGTMTFNVRGNTFRDANGSAITLFKASAPGTPTVSGIFDNNTIGVAATVGSGSATGNGIFVSAGGTGSMSYTITNNIIHRINGNCHIFADNTGGSYTANFTIQGNTLDTPGPTWFAGIAITNGSPTSGDLVNVCAVIGGSLAAQKNKLNFISPLNLGVIVGSSGANGGHTFNLPGLATFTEAGVESFITGNNTSDIGFTFFTDAYADAPATFAAFTGSGTSCPTP